MSDIVVYGSGKTGRSIVKLLEKLHKTSVLYDDLHGFYGDGGFSSSSIVLLSPGVPPNAHGLAEAEKCGACLVAELELCSWLCKGRCISVTGTNGKTTTCEMIYRILTDCGRKSRLLGNGGIPFSEQVLDVDCDETVVLESSSFQLERCRTFSPYVSVLTNLAPDHINWHGSFENYRKAKQNNFIRQIDGYALFNMDDAAAAAMSDDCRCAKLYYSCDNPRANCFIDGSGVTVRGDGREIHIDSLFSQRFVGHDISNALAAILACACVGVSPNDAMQSLKDFVFLSHRLQRMDSIDGVTFIDDSKATNVHATVSALGCFSEPLALIMGGSDKGESFDSIFFRLPSNVLQVAAVGQTANAIKESAARYGIGVKIFDEYDEAIRFCFHRMQPCGGIVLMSNACASFDKFGGFEERGEYFKKIVKEIEIENSKN